MLQLEGQLWDFTYDIILCLLSDEEECEKVECTIKNVMQRKRKQKIINLKFTGDWNFKFAPLIFDLKKLDANRNEVNFNLLLSLLRKKRGFL